MVGRMLEAQNGDSDSRSILGNQTVYIGGGTRHVAEIYFCGGDVELPKKQSFGDWKVAQRHCWRLMPICCMNPV